MSYLGRGLEQVDNISKLDNITFNGSTTYALTKDSAAFTPISSNAILISIDGVVQQGNFSVSGTNIVFNFSPTSSNTCNWILHMGTGVAFTPADSSVTKDKANFISTSSAAGLQIKGDGTTDGTLQLNCSQNSHGVKIKSPAHSAGQSYTLTLPTTSPASNKIMQTDGSGNLSFVDAPSGGLQLVTSFTPGSEGSTIVVDNCFTSTYDRYVVYCERLRNGNDGARLEVYLRTGGSSGSDSGNLGGAYLGYRYNNQYMSGSYTNSANAIIASSVKNDYYYNLMMHFIQPHDSAFATSILGQSVYRESPNDEYGFLNFGYQPDNTVSHTGFAITLSAGNFNQTNSTIKVYGIVDS